MLLEDTLKHPIEPGNAPANVRCIELERQDRVVPRELFANIHGVSLRAAGWHTGAI
jgi:hypothetical protein